MPYDEIWPKKRPLFYVSVGKVSLLPLTVVIMLLAGGCAQESKKPATGPLRVKLQLVNLDGTAAATANLHLLTITRDAQGELSGVTEHFGELKMVAEAAPIGAVRLEIPREMVNKGEELSLALNPPGGIPAALQQGSVMLTFKVDPVTEEIDLGKIVVK
jgi:hypothetical protein